MTLLSHLVQSLLCPGLLSALLVGLLCRGLSAWAGALVGRRPARPPWQPFSDIVHLAGKSPARNPGRTALLAGPGLLGLVALAWATGMLPWPHWSLATEDLPGGFFLYLVLLAVPPLARLLAAGFSAQPQAALGARRQAPIELARLLPLLLAAAGLSLFTQRFTLSQEMPLTLWSALVGGGVAGVLLATLPWPLWDQDAHEAPLAGLGGRALAIFRTLEALELAAQIGLIAVVLRASGLFPPGWSDLVLLLAFIAALAVLVIFEARGRRVLLPEMARVYTRWALPLALLVAALGWWLGR
jgi:formate hydrogenlyase subunit 4